jgi:Flp pilus assembly protein TadG
VLSLRARLPDRKSERGVSSIELVLYMPLLMMAIFLTVQFSLLYLGNQVISSSARQAARVARTGVGSDQANRVQAEAVAQEYAAKVGRGLVTNVLVDVTKVTGASGPEIKVVVTAQTLQLVPGVAAPKVSKTVQGPVESFRVDTRAGTP